MYLQSDSDFVFAAVLLAAGKSSRMGSPKMLLPWRHTNVLGWGLEQWRRLGAKQIAVVIDAKGPVWGALDELRCDLRIVNPAPEQGMFSSIRCASAWGGWSSSITHFAIILGDQPNLRNGTLAQLLEFSATNPGRVCQPSYDGKARHPVIMPRCQFEQLSQTSSENLKQFLAKSNPGPLQCAVDDPNLAWDMDTPADYERLRASPS